MSPRDSALLTSGKEALDRADKLVSRLHLILGTAAITSFPDLASTLGSVSLPFLGSVVPNSKIIAVFAVVLTLISAINFNFLGSRLRLIAEHFEDDGLKTVLFLHPSKLTDPYHAESTYLNLVPIFCLALIVNSTLTLNFWILLTVSIAIGVSFFPGSWQVQQAFKGYRVRRKKVMDNET